MKDRLVRGASAGAVGGVWILGWNLFSVYVLHFAKATWTDALSQLVVSHTAKSAGDWVVAIGLLFLFNAVLGALFARYVIPERDGNYVLRAIGFGLAAWFVLMSIGTLYKIPLLSKLVWQTAVSNWVAVIGWGILTGWLLGRWDDLAAEAR